MNKSEQKNYLDEMNDAITDLKFYLANQNFLPELNQKDVSSLGKNFVQVGKAIQAVAKQQSK